MFPSNPIKNRNVLPQPPNNPSLLIEGQSQKICLFSRGWSAPAFNLILLRAKGKTLAGGEICRVDKFRAGFFNHENNVFNQKCIFTPTKMYLFCTLENDLSCLMGRVANKQKT